MTQGRWEVHLRRWRYEHITEVVSVGHAPDGEVVDVVEGEVVGQHELDIHSVVVTQHFQTESRNEDLMNLGSRENVRKCVGDHIFVRKWFPTRM